MSATNLVAATTAVGRKPAAPNRNRTVVTFAIVLLCLTLAFASPALAWPPSADVDGILPNPVTVVSTVPENGDVNPYGVAFVPKNYPSGGIISPGDILVSNFNNKANQQGTGTTIIRVPATGSPTLFFGGPTGLGLTTALSVFKNGPVVVGNLPTTDGTCATATAGSLLVIDKSGHKVAELTDSKLINGPWDSTFVDHGGNAKLFVSNVLSGTVARFDLMVSSMGVMITKSLQVASGYTHRCDPAALVVGPTGLAYDAMRDILYVASTADNAIFAVHGAGTATADKGMGSIIYMDDAHLHGPLHLVLASNGHFITSNSDVINADPAQPSELVEFTRWGQFLKQLSMDPAQGGSFGFALGGQADDQRLASVNDNAANLTIWTLTDLPHGHFGFYEMSQQPQKPAVSRSSSQ